MRDMCIRVCVCVCKKHTDLQVSGYFNACLCVCLCVCLRVCVIEVIEEG